MPVRTGSFPRCSKGHRMAESFHWENPAGGYVSAWMEEEELVLSTGDTMRNPGFVEIALPVAATRDFLAWLKEQFPEAT